MPLTSYHEVRPWAASIREAVLSGSMPPWHETAGAHAFRNNRSLTPAERTTITSWVDAHCPEGDALPAYRAPVKETGWRLGTPDFVARIPGFAVPKAGVLPYSFLIIPLHLDHDTWISAAEFRIGNRAVIHHINAFIRPPGSSFLADSRAGVIFAPALADRARKRPGEAVFARRQLLLGYEPGYRPMPWIDGGAKLIPAGSDLIFEMHYTPNGTPVTDFSEFGLYFSQAPPVRRVIAIDTLRDLDLDIPPGGAHYTSQASMTLARSVSLLSVQPHMHLRGAAMEVKAFFPDGKSTVLINVPKFDFNWQTTYVLSDPLPLPAGTRLESRAVFNNSANNAFNPNPAAEVHWGDQTSDEMHIAFLELILDPAIDPNTIFAAPPKGLAAPPATAAK